METGTENREGVEVGRVLKKKKRLLFSEIKPGKLILRLSILKPGFSFRSECPWTDLSESKRRHQKKNDGHDKRNKGRDDNLHDDHLKKEKEANQQPTEHPRRRYTFSLLPSQDPVFVVPLVVIPMRFLRQNHLTSHLINL